MLNSSVGLTVGAHFSHCFMNTNSLAINLCDKPAKELLQLYNLSSKTLRSGVLQNADIVVLLKSTTAYSRTCPNGLGQVQQPVIKDSCAVKWKDILSGISKNYKYPQFHSGQVLSSNPYRQVRFGCQTNFLKHKHAPSSFQSFGDFRKVLKEYDPCFADEETVQRNYPT